MVHPFFNNRIYLAYYWLIWIAISVLHVFILNFYSIHDLSVAVVDSLLTNFSFAIIGFSIWYPVRYIDAKEQNLMVVVFGHVLAAILLILFWFLISNYFIHYFLEETDGYEKFYESTKLYRLIVVAFLYLVLLLIYVLIEYYNNLQEKALHEITLQNLVKQSELNYLKAQINPHFLFNSLNSISSLTITNSAKAHEMIILLSDFLRYSLSQSAVDETLFKTEIENIRKYLNIEKIRFEDRLDAQFEIEDQCLEKSLPIMLLQPLFENAIKHGVQSSSETTRVFFSCTFVKKHLVIELSNEFDNSTPPRKGEGIGIESVKNRLKLIYKQDDLMLVTKSDNLFTVKIYIPQL